MKKIFNNKFVNWSIKILILVLLSWAIYAQVLGKDNLNELWAEFKNKCQTGNLYWLVGCLLLLPMNWVLETQKWRTLLSPVVDLPFWKSMQAILAGITVAIFTPNRVGEYGGRVLLVDSKHNWHAIVATFVGSISQIAALLTCGLFGLLYFAWRFLEVDTFVLGGITLIGVSLLGILFFSFYNIDLVVPFLKRIPYVNRFEKQLEFFQMLKEYSNRLLSKALILSFLRYLTYSTQFFLLLQFFGVNAPFLEALAGISTVFLVQTSIPLPPVTGLLTRGQVALFVWSFFGGNEISVLAATYSLFVINLILPALIGAVFILKTNVLKSLGYANESK